MAISADKAGEASALRGRLDLAFALLADEGVRVTRAFGVEEGGKGHPRPATYVLDGDRKVVFRHVGANAADRPALDDILDAL